MNRPLENIKPPATAATSAEVWYVFNISTESSKAYLLDATALFKLK